MRTLVSVVDDDESVREALPDLIREFGYAVRAFSSGEEFLASNCLGDTGCLILDVAMPGMTGPEVQQELARGPYDIPIIFITGHREDGQRLSNLDAAACLLKPFSDDALREALAGAFRAI